MIHRFAISLATLTLIGLAPVLANAQRATAGPFLDFRSEVQPTNAEITYQTVHFRPLLAVQNPSPNGDPLYFALPAHISCVPGNPTPSGQFCVLFEFYDAVKFGGIDFSQRVAGVAFHTNDNVAVNGDRRITTIYGLDLNPQGSSIILGGVNAANPEFTATGERFLGGNGNIYEAGTAAAVQVGALSSFLGPTFDLSIFSGDPTRLVYVFDTIIPNSDLGTFPTSPIPEPSTTILMLAGFASLACCARRQRARIRN